MSNSKWVFLMLLSGLNWFEVLVAIAFTFNLTFTLTPSVTLVAKEVSFNGPALFATDSRLQNQRAVLTLEALKMIIPVHCPQPWSLRLSFLWHNRLLAACAHDAELLCVVLCTVDPVV